MAKNYKENFNDEDGVWRTVGGRRVFIKNGQSLSEAMIESGKFKNLRSDYKKAKEEEAKKEEKKTDLKEKVATDDTYKAVSDYENGAKDYKETLERFGGDKEKMSARFKEMGYKSPVEYGEAKEQKEASSVWEKQPDGTYKANKDAMKAEYEKNHKNYDAKIKQFAEDRKNMTNGDWEGMLMAYEKQNADGTYKTLQDIMDDVDKYEKVNGEETERLEIAKDIAKEVYGLNEKNASPERIEKEARRILEPNDGEVLEKGDQPYTNSKGELERSTKSLKEWRDELKKTKEPRDELAEASGGVISTLKTSIPESKMERLKPGTEIYYKGDMANIEGYFTVEKVEPEKEQFMTSVTLKEKGGEGRTFKIGAQQIENDYGKDLGSRFSFKEDYMNYRNKIFEGYKKKAEEIKAKSTNETMNNAIREKAGSNYYKGTKRQGFGYANNDNIPVYQNKIDYSGDFTHANLSKVSDKDLVKIADKQNQLYNEAVGRQVGDRRTYNGKKDQLFKDVETLRYGNGLDVVSKEMEQRGLSPNNQISNTLRQKAYQKYLKEHPASKITFEQFKDMRK